MLKKKIIIFIIVLLFLTGGFFLIRYNEKNIKNKEHKEQENKKKEDNKKLLENIKRNYNKNVVTTIDTKLYKKENEKFIEVGIVYKDTNLTLENKDDFNIKDLYFKLDNLNYYISYKNIKPQGDNINKNIKNTTNIVDKKNYKNYIPFDFDIITKNITNFYLESKKIMTINKSFTFQVLINDDNGYYVEYGNKLLKIKKEDVDKKINNPKKREVATAIGVVNYHFFYNPEKNEKCNESICLSNNNFEKHLKYLKDNKFYTASMKDINLWLKKKIILPKKTVVITIDDGGMGTDKKGNILLPLLEKYELHGTLFLITSYWDKKNYESPMLEIQSHGYNIHNHRLPYVPAFRMTKEELVKDLKKSIEVLDGQKDAFCYPFYAYNKTVLSAVKESGFDIAFIGGNRKITQNSNPYLLTRYPIYRNTSLQAFIKMVN